MSKTKLMTHRLNRAAVDGLNTSVRSHLFNLESRLKRFEETGSDEDLTRFEDAWTSIQIDFEALRESMTKWHRSLDALNREKAA